MSDVAQRIAEALKGIGNTQYVEVTGNDVYVEGYLSELLEFMQDWRSEIEEKK